MNESQSFSLKLKNALFTALCRAWHESLGDDQDFPLGPRHRSRSTRFIREFGCLLDGWYDSDQFEVHWKREGRPVPRKGEVLHDFDVFAMEAEILQTNILQVESEFAYMGRNPLNPRPRKNKLLEDLNKLICGCAENSLLITSLEWLSDEGEWFLSTVRRAARRWHSLNSTNTKVSFYVALIPFVSKWHALTEKELQCDLMTFNSKTGDYEIVE